MLVAHICLFYIKIYNACFKIKGCFLSINSLVKEYVAWILLQVDVSIHLYITCYFLGNFCYSLSYTYFVMSIPTSELFAFLDILGLNNKSRPQDSFGVLKF